MRMKLGRGAFVSLLAMALLACSGSPPSTNSEADNMIPPPPAPNVVEPVLPEPVINQAAQAPCPETPGSVCTGPLMVRGEGFNLMREDRAAGADYVIAQGALVFENRTSAPVKFALLDERIVVNLDNGQTLGTFRDSFSGITLCGRDGAACFRDTPDRFQSLVPGDSPIRVTGTFRGDEMSSLRAGTPSVATATITLQVYVVDANNAGSVLSISLVGVPVQNQIRQ